jgi:SAM-dependent methyltransferase
MNQSKATVKAGVVDLVGKGWRSRCFVDCAGAGAGGTLGQMQSQPHSVDQFGPQRDFWWNRDFLDLMATRWRLHEAASLADIGCGRCHWSRLLYPYLLKPARVTGVDREQQWVAEAPELFRRTFPETSPDQLTFVQGDATKIPLPDDSFDVVTCQTVLMHLAQPLEALREMVRILRPGGLLLCVEPNNLWNYVPFTSLTATEPVESIVRRFEFWLRYHRGKIGMGQGDHMIGDLIPGYFAQLNLTGIAVYQSDRAPSVFPPYASPGQQAVIEQERQSKRAAIGPWDREEVLKCVLRGGGNEEFFECLFSDLSQKFAHEQQAIQAGTFHAANGSLFYLVSGRKP